MTAPIRLSIIPDVHENLSVMPSQSSNVPPYRVFVLPNTEMLRETEGVGSLPLKLCALRVLEDSKLALAESSRLGLKTFSSEEC